MSPRPISARRAPRTSTRIAGVKNRHRIGLHGWLALVLGTASLAAQDGPKPPVQGQVSIDHPWSPPTPAGRPVGVAYLSITNHGKTAESLLRVSTPAADDVQIHQTTIDGGMAHMRPLEEVEIAPGKTVKIEPGGIHLMLMGLKRELATGTTVPLTLVFRDAGAITVALRIENR